MHARTHASTHTGHERILKCACLDAQVGPVTSSVMNTAKRVIVIIACAIIFGEQMDRNAKIGAAVAVSGLSLCLSLLLLVSLSLFLSVRIWLTACSFAMGGVASRTRTCVFYETSTGF
jgi:hypothetical protein